MRIAHSPRKRKPAKPLTHGIAHQNTLLNLIERRWLQEADIADAVHQAHHPDLYHAQPTPTGGDGSGHALISDPTANLAIQGACPLDSIRLDWHATYETIPLPETWLHVFTATRQGCDAICRDIIRRRFQGEPYYITCRELYLSTSTYYHYVREILHYTLACAIHARLIDPRTPHPTAQPTPPAKTNTSKKNDSPNTAEAKADAPTTDQTDKNADTNSTANTTQADNSDSVATGESATSSNGEPAKASEPTTPSNGDPAKASKSTTPSNGDPAKASKSTTPSNGDPANDKSPSPNTAPHKEPNPAPKKER